MLLSLKNKLVYNCLTAREVSKEQVEKVHKAG
jgi:hypothetical protein